MSFLCFWILLSFHFSFFLVCISSGVSAFIRQHFFLAYPSFVLPYCGSLHAALSSFLIPFRLVRSCFGALLPSLRFVCFGRNLLWGFLSFTTFRLRSFQLQVAIVFPCWCVHIPFGCFSLILDDNFVFLFFSFMLISSIVSAVSHLALFILAPWVAYLPASLFFSFSQAMRRTFLFSSCPFGVIVFLPPVVPCGVFQDLFAIFFSCAISWSWSPQFSSVLFFLFCIFEIIQCVCPASFLVTVEPFPELLGFFWHFLLFLCCPCFSPVPYVSTPPTGFPSDAMGLVSVPRVAAAPSVPCCCSSFV